MDKKPAPDWRRISRVSWIALGAVTILFFLFLPIWPYSLNWGIAPSALTGFAIFFIVVILLLGAFSSEDYT